MVRRGQRQRAYNPVSSTGDDAAAPEAAADDDSDVEAPRRGGGYRGPCQYEMVACSDNNNKDKDTVASEEIVEEEGTQVTIVIMDPAQNKFLVPAYTHWTVQKLKEQGEKIHKVAPPSQRLIYRGQLLQDSSTLEKCGLHSDKLIVHLFPKPRLVIQQPSTTTTCTATEDHVQEATTGAHIPQIVLNPHEAEERAHILVLSNPDFVEAHNNVKLFSIMLLVISSIELFNLFLILMGVTPDNNNGTTGDEDTHNFQDNFFHMDMNSTNDPPNPYSRPYGPNGVPGPTPYEVEMIQQELHTWHPRNNVDLIIAAVGVYVAMLGIRASNEITVRLAKQYLLGTILVGFAWIMYNYWFMVHIDEEVDEWRFEERHNQTANPGAGDLIPHKTELEYYQQNLTFILIPGLIWVSCCMRAWQFQSLLQEAEQEAQERIRNELEQFASNINDSGSSRDEQEMGGANRGGRNQGAARGGRTHDLELQNPSVTR